MKMIDQLQERIAAGYSALWIRSYEHRDAMEDIAEFAADKGMKLWVWDAERGALDPSKNFVEQAVSNIKSPDPDDQIKLFHSVREEMTGNIAGLVLNNDFEPDANQIIVLKNYHLHLLTHQHQVANGYLLQALLHTIETGHEVGIHIVVLSYDGVVLPRELEKVFTVLDHDLPDEDELYDIMTTSGISEDCIPERNSEAATIAIESAKGLTREEATNAFALSIVRHKDLRPDEIWETKAEMLKHTSGLEMMKTDVLMDDVVGLDPLKQYLEATFTSERRMEPDLKPRGVFLFGVPGSGKSMMAKALGNKIGLPTVRLDIGSLMGSLVGETEEKTRIALKRIDSMDPCIVFIDEIEKGLAGGDSAGDSGVGARQMGSLLSWMEDRQSFTPLIVTANNIESLTNKHPELFRRFDSLFFMDYPSREQKDAAWEQYSKKYGLNCEQDIPDDPLWTIAEVKKCCIEAARLGVPLVEACKHVVPISRTAEERISNMREWANNRAQSADYPGVYNKNHAAKSGAGIGATTTTPKRAKRRAIHSSS